MPNEHEEFWTSSSFALVGHSAAKVSQHAREVPQRLADLRSHVINSHDTAFLIQRDLSTPDLD